MLATNSICIGRFSDRDSFDKCDLCCEVLNYPLVFCFNETTRKIEHIAHRKCSFGEKCTSDNCERKIVLIRAGEGAEVNAKGISTHRIIDLKIARCRFCGENLPESIKEFWFHLYDEGKTGQDPHVYCLPKLRHPRFQIANKKLPCIPCKNQEFIHIKFEQPVRMRDIEISNENNGDENSPLLGFRSNACRRNAWKICKVVSCILGIGLGVTIALAAHGKI